MPQLRTRFQPKQRLFLRYVLDRSLGCPTKIAYGGARGGGKSKAGRDVMILLCLMFGGIDCLILRRTWKEVYRNHVVPMFREFPDLRVFWNESKKTLQFPNGSNLIFGYAEHKDDIYDFQGNEYAFILVEEATHFNEEELTFLDTCNRWTKNPAILPKLLYTTNPGNVGHEYIKRVFVDKDYRENERKEDFVFIQAYGWDNVEWSTSTFLREAGVEPLTWKSWTGEKRREFLEPKVDWYYRLSEQSRFDFFVQKTDYGRKLNAMTGPMRDAHLFGSWDSFVGQYFVEWNRKIHVVRPFPIPEYWERFASFDWGYRAPACTLWHAVSPEGRVFTYRELYVKQRDSVWLAEKNRTMSRGESIRYCAGDPACWQTKDGGVSIAETMAQHGWAMIQAENDRINGWARVRQYLAWEIDTNGVLTRPPLWQIFDRHADYPGLGCPNLIRTLPAQVHDEFDPEDLDTSGEDHGADTARYGLMTRPIASTVPLEAMADEYAEATRRAEHNERESRQRRNSVDLT